MIELPDPVVLTEDELLSHFAGGQPEQLAIRNLIHTMFTLVEAAGGITQEGLGDALAALTGTVTIGGDILRAAGAIDLGPNSEIQASADSISLGGDIQVDCSSHEITFSPEAIIWIDNIQTSDGTAGTLWVDTGAANVLKRST